MTEPTTCPRCGKILPADAPAGVCPKCLLAVGLDRFDEDAIEQTEGLSSFDQAAPVPHGRNSDDVRCEKTRSLIVGTCTSSLHQRR